MCSGLKKYSQFMRVFLFSFKFPCIIILYRLSNLVFCIHNEWSVVSNRLSEWFTCHEEDFCACIPSKSDTFTNFREVDHVSMMVYLVSYHDIPFCDQYCCSVSLRNCGSELTFSIEPDVIELYRRKCLCSSTNSIVFPCNHTNSSS